MNKTLETTKLWRETKRLIRLICGYTGESMVEMIHRVVSEEFNRLKPELRKGLE